MKRWRQSDYAIAIVAAGIHWSAWHQPAAAGEDWIGLVEESGGQRCKVTVRIHSATFDGKAVSVKMANGGKIREFKGTVGKNGKFSAWQVLEFENLENLRKSEEPFNLNGEFTGDTFEGVLYKSLGVSLAYSPGICESSVKLARRGTASAAAVRFVAHPVPWTQVCLTRRA